MPVLEALQRRHSDIKIGSGSSGSNAGVLEGGLAPPRSPELRRHSDVSPASLKEIEKVSITSARNQIYVQLINVAVHTVKRVDFQSDSVFPTPART